MQLNIPNLMTTQIPLKITDVKEPDYESVIKNKYITNKSSTHNTNQ